MIGGGPRGKTLQIFVAYTQDMPLTAMVGKLLNKATVCKLAHMEYKHSQLYMKCIQPDIYSFKHYCFFRNA